MATGSLATLPLLASSPLSSRSEELVILHTNDVHSHIHPFSDEHSRYASQGGVIARAALIDEIRQKHRNVLLLDAGDMFQGTPFFNFYGGELEIKLMSKLNYDAATIGNHDFDGGVEGLFNAWKNANFQLLNANYTFENDLNKIVKPYQIFKKGKLKIGVLGIGIELEGLVDSKMCKGTYYNDPVINANRCAKELKSKGCDYVICLSHLGFKYKGSKMSDILLAKSSENIDLIIGGHTHSFLEEPSREINSVGAEVLVSQAGWAGLRLGVIKVEFNSEKILSEGLTLNV